MSAQNLAVIAGSGDLPRLVAERHPDALVITLGENGAHPGRTGNMLKSLREAGIGRLCLIGGLKRPSWASLWPSWESWKLIVKYGFSFAGGDDALLKRLRGILESEGFELVGVQTLCPELLTPEGVLAAPATPISDEDLSICMDQAKSFGREDKGQAVAIAARHIVDTEDKKGTNALILRNARTDAILVKVSKPHQDMDLDMPTIGPETIQKAGLAGFMAVVLEAGRTLMVDRDRCIELAKAHNLGLIGVRYDA